MTSAPTSTPADSLPADSLPRPEVPEDWVGWTAVDRATLCFVVTGDRILLIRKKRGLGAGKINGPGGKVHGDESLLQCALRETREELRIDPRGLQRAGRLLFQFTDGYSIDVTVFRAGSYEGDPTETDEAVPLWFALDDVPFHEMWQDDELWFPLLLEGRPFLGRFLFDGDRMVSHHLEMEDRPR